MNLNKITFTPSITKKGEYGLQYLENEVHFYKKNTKYLYNNSDMQHYVDFRCSKPVLIDKNNNITYFPFDSDLYNNTLYDTLYFKGKFWNKRKLFFKKIENQININYGLTEFKETNSKKFFSDRVNDINKSIEYSRNKDILNNVINKINTIDQYLFRVYLSNGDLTDTNICLNGSICDTECFGYNVVIADMAIFFVSMIYGCWIYPKYNPQAYAFRKNKIINPYMKLSINQLDIMKRIMNIINPIEYDIFKNLVIMRLVTPIGLDMMDYDDRANVDNLIRIIYYSDYITLIPNISKYIRGK